MARKEKRREERNADGSGCRVAFGVSARLVHVLGTQTKRPNVLSDKIEYRAQISGVLVKQAVALVRIQ